jgi:hypothetical protein
MSQPMAQQAFTATGLRVSDYLTTVPRGYNTVLGYLATRAPHLLAFMDEDAEATLRDGYWLKRQAEREGHRVVKVPAPAHLVRQGIFEVNAYPEFLLDRRFD